MRLYVGKRVGPFWLGVSQQVGGSRNRGRRPRVSTSGGRAPRKPPLINAESFGMKYGSRARRIAWRIVFALFALLLVLAVLLIIVAATGNWS
jgi:hypothetical protein